MGAEGQAISRGRGPEHIEKAAEGMFVWLLLAILALVAAAATSDGPFAVHMVICALAAVLAAAAAVRRVGAPLRSIPAGEYDDDVIRWGTIATVFWAVVGF